MIFFSNNIFLFQPIDTAKAFFELNNVSQIAPVIAAFFAILTFIVLYLAVFRLRVYLSSRVTYYIERNTVEPDIIYLKSIVTPIIFLNRTRQFGIVYNILLRVYSDDELNPNSVKYLASNIFTKFPLNKTEYDAEVMNKLHFSPLGIEPKSSVDKVINFGNNVDSSSLIIKPNGNFILELFYKKRIGSDWKFGAKYYLLNDDPLGSRTVDAKDCIGFNLIDYTGKDSNLASNLPKEKTNIYKGVSDDFWSEVTFRTKRIFRIILKIVYNIILFMPRHTYYLFDFFWGALVKRLVMRINLSFKSKNYEDTREEIRNKSFNKLWEILKKQVDYFNKHNNTELTISEKLTGRFEIKRDGKVLRIYMTGAGTIIADTPAQERIFLRYQIEIKDSLLHYLYYKRYNDDIGWIRKVYFGFLRLVDRFLIFPKWAYHDGGRTSIRAFALNILDGFIFHSKH